MQEPDPRQIQLADDYKAPWVEAVVKSCTPDRLAVEAGTNEATYRLLDSRSPLKVGDLIQVCAEWSLVRQADYFVVILPVDDDQTFALELSPTLPADASDWTPEARAGWIYGYQKWLENEDWIDVSFLDLGDDPDFRAYAFEAYTDMHLADEDESDS